MRRETRLESRVAVGVEVVLASELSVELYAESAPAWALFANSLLYEAPLHLFFTTAATTSVFLIFFLC